MSSANNIEWAIVRSYKEFVHFLQNNPLPDIVSFDHDLAHEHVQDLIDQAGIDYEQITIHYEKFTEKTGLDAAKWLVQWCEDNELDLPVCTVHSANPAGSANIINYLNNYVLRTNRVAIVKRTIW